MLILKDITAGYLKGHMILKGINLMVAENEVVALVGQNGSGKSTLAKAIMNLLPYKEGKVLFTDIGISHKETSLISKSGIGFFMQGGKIFPNLTMKENLLFACGDKDKKNFSELLDGLHNYFELFRNGRMNLQASYLSGGEQNLLALAMVLIKRPKFLILDEPSAGLSPVNIKILYDALYKIIKNQIKSILIIEQNVNTAIEISNRVVKLEAGTIKNEELTKNLNTPEKIDEFFFGKIKKETL